MAARTRRPASRAAAVLEAVEPVDPDELPPHEILHVRDPHTVDEWGRDPGAIRRLSLLTSLRWDVSVGGTEHINHRGGIIVINTRRFALTPIFTALALSESLDRPVRFVGRPDIVPFGPVLRRLGGLLAQPAEIAGAIRAGELVVVGASPTANARHAGIVDPALIAPAIREHVAVYIAAALSSTTSRYARVEVGAVLRGSRTRRGPLAEVELAEHAQHRLQMMLDEFGPNSLDVPDVGLPGLGLSNMAKLAGTALRGGR